MRHYFILAGAILQLAAFSLLSNPAYARDQLTIVGSSTVFPFTTTVAENFGKSGSFKTPIVESTGTGGGFKLFCAGLGEDTPDISDASRPIKDSEKETCAKNGVTAISEIPLGYDGIVVAQSKAAPGFDLTTKNLYLALAKEVPVGGKLIANPYKTWKDIDSSLPDRKIEILGPPPTSGTRDAFVELVMDKACAEFPEIKSLDSESMKKACQSMREDGAFVEAGENDNLIVQKLIANPHALGIFGYSFLENNADKIEGAKINGVVPEYEAIAAGTYPLSRILYIYVKDAHAGVIPGIKEFVAEYMSDAALGEDGYLAEKGLILFPADKYEEIRAKAMNLTPMN